MTRKHPEYATYASDEARQRAAYLATRRVLADVAGVVPGVEHVEVDAEHHLELVRRVHVLRTPTRSTRSFAPPPG